MNAVLEGSLAVDKTYITISCWLMAVQNVVKGNKMQDSANH
jgi:hypothetical protein